MADVTLPLKTAQDGFPAICAMTGVDADGSMSLQVGRTRTRWRSPGIQIPLSQPVFTRWSRRQNIHIKARGLATVLLTVGIALTFRSAATGLPVVGAALVVHLLDLWAERGAARSRPVIERDGANVVLKGVHETFATAVSQLT